MRILQTLTISIVLLLVTVTSAVAQFPVLSAEDVIAWSKRNAVVVDSRIPEEYQAGHIPGAINIPAERMKMEASLLPRDKARPIVFYCRGAG